MEKDSRTDRDLLIQTLDRVDRSLVIVIELFKSISNAQAIQSRLILDFIEDQKVYRAKREEGEIMSTKQKIEAELNKRSFTTYFVDRVLPALIIAAILWFMKAY